MTPDITCKECGREMSAGSTEMTCVGYFSLPGHNHDDNCVSRTYICMGCKRRVGVSIKRRCPNPDCKWEGKSECWCHKGPKLDRWPQPGDAI